MQMHPPPLQYMPSPMLPRTDDVITAGPNGVRCWSSYPDTETYAKASVVAAAERPILTPAGLPMPWAYGKFERARLKHVYG